MTSPILSIACVWSSGFLASSGFVSWLLGRRVSGAISVIYAAALLVCNALL